MTGIVSVTGLASGIDTDSIITKLLDLQNQEVTKLTARQTARSTQLAAWTGLQTAVFSLRSAGQALDLETTWNGFSAASGNTDVLDATAGSGATEGSYTISVNRLAQAHQIASQGFADTNATHTGTGVMEITIGGTTTEVAIDANHDTLAGIRDAVNAAGIGVSASIINRGSGSDPYQLVLTSDKTGAAYALSVASRLTGGTAPSFASTRGDAVLGTWSGSASPTAGGSYSGAGDKAFTFTVASSGTIGGAPLSVNWDDGRGGSGTLAIPASYTPGSALAVADGVTVSFGSGTLVAGDTFSIAVTSPTIQAAQDAELSLGSSSGGGDPIVVTRSTNTVDDLIPGVTLDLKGMSTSPVSLSVTRDTKGIHDAVNNFVNAYNSLLDLAGSQSTYDAASKTAAPLLGDSGLMSLKSQVRSIMTGSVPEVSGDLNMLMSLGVTAQSDGQLSVDFTKLDGLVASDYSGVEQVLRGSGTATDPDVTYRSSTAKTRASSTGYAVKITQAATQATYAGASMNAPGPASPLTIGDSNHTLLLSVDGVQSGAITLTNGLYTSGAALAQEIQTRVNADPALSASQVAVSWVDEGSGRGHLQVQSARYGSASSISWRATANDAYATLGFTAGASAIGRDVAGTIGGEAATGNGQILTGNEGNANTDGLSLIVKVTPEDLAAQGSAQGSVSFSRGLGDLVASWADGVTDTSGGLIVSREGAIQKQIDAIAAQITNVQKQVSAKRDQLVKQFAQMETVLAQLQSESSFLASSLGTTSTSTSSTTSPTINTSGG